MNAKTNKARFIAALGLVLVLAGATSTAQAQGKVPVPPAPETHSHQMAKTMKDPATKSDVSRLDGDLRSIDKDIQIVKNHIGKLRAVLAVSTSEKTKDELAKYEAVSSALEAARASTARVQIAISSCSTLCAKAELAAIEGKPSPSDHHQQMMAFIFEADAETQKLSDAVAHLKKQAADLPYDPNLPSLTASLEKSVEALKKTTAMCMGTVQHGTSDHAAVKMTPGS